MVCPHLQHLELPVRTNVDAVKLLIPHLPPTLISARFHLSQVGDSRERFRPLKSLVVAVSNHLPLLKLLHLSDSHSRERNPVQENLDQELVNTTLASYGLVLRIPRRF